MIEMDETEYFQSTVSDEVLLLIASFCGEQTAHKMLFSTVPTYDQIMQSGSPELVEVVFLITGGIAPGGRDNEKTIVPTLSNLTRNDHRYSS